MKMEEALAFVEVFLETPTVIKPEPEHAAEKRLINSPAGYSFVEPTFWHAQ
jgi:hypothetical protein